MIFIIDTMKKNIRQRIGIKCESALIDSPIIPYGGLFSNDLKIKVLPHMHIMYLMIYSI